MSHVFRVPAQARQPRPWFALFVPPPPDVTDTVIPGVLTIVGAAGLNQVAGASDTVTAGVLTIAGASGLEHAAGKSDTVSPGVLSIVMATGVDWQVGGASDTVVPGVLLIAAASGLAVVTGASSVVTAGVLFIVGAAGLAIEGQVAPIQSLFAPVFNAVQSVAHAVTSLFGGDRPDNQKRH